MKSYFNILQQIYNVLTDSSLHRDRKCDEDHRICCHQIKTETGYDIWYANRRSRAKIYWCAWNCLAIVFCCKISFSAASRNNCQEIKTTSCWWGSPQDWWQAKWKDEWCRYGSSASAATISFVWSIGRWNPAIQYLTWSFLNQSMPSIDFSDNSCPGVVPPVQKICSWWKATKFSFGWNICIYCVFFCIIV